MTAIHNSVKLYIHYMTMNIKSAMQYKISFILSVIGHFLVTFNVFLGIYFVFSRFNGIKGFTYNEVLLCYSTILFSYSFSEMYARGFDSFSGMVRDSSFDRILVRPRNEILQVLGSKFELNRIGRLLQGTIIFIYGIISNDISWTYDKILTISFMLLGGIALFTGIFMIGASFCFFTLEGLEFMNILTDGFKEYGKYPLNVYGKKMLMFTTFVFPYALVQYYPLMYVLGRSDNKLFIFLPLLAILFLIPSCLFWNFGVKHYKSNGS